jgi:hypothetical protein
MRARARAQSRFSVVSEEGSAPCSPNIRVPPPRPAPPPAARRTPVAARPEGFIAST